MSSSSAAEAAIGPLEKRYKHLTGYVEPAIKAIPSSLIGRVFAKIGAFFQWLFRCENWVPGVLKACRIADASQDEESKRVANRILELEECRYVVRTLCEKPNESLARKLHEYLFHPHSNLAIDADIISLIRVAVERQSASGTSKDPVVLSRNRLSLTLPQGTNFKHLSIYESMEKHLRPETPEPRLHSQAQTPEPTPQVGMFLPYQERAAIPQASGAFKHFGEIRRALGREDSNLTEDLLKSLYEVERRGEPQTQEAQTKLSRAVYVIRFVCVPNFRSSDKDRGFPLMRKVLADILSEAESVNTSGITLTSLEERLGCIREFFADRIKGEGKDKIVALLETIEQNIKSLSLRQGANSVKILETVKASLAHLIVRKGCPDLGVDNIISTLEPVKAYLQKQLVGKISLADLDRPD